MTTPVLNDVTWLFRQVVEHLHANPGQALSEERWKKQSSDLSLGDEMMIFVGSTAIRLQNVELLPLIAAVALGHTRQQVLKVINNHWLDPYFLSNAWFNEIAEEDPRNDFGEFFTREPSKWEVCHEYIQSISMDDDAAKEFINLLAAGRDHHELSVACLLSNRAEFWPVSELTRIIENQTPERYEVPTPTCLESFLWKSIKLNEFSDEQILVLLERSGNFVEGMEEENGLPTNFFFNLLTKNDINPFEGENRNKKRILLAINAVDNPEVRQKIERLILAELTSHDFYKGVTEGVMLFNSLLKSLDPLVYPKVFGSVLLKVNATSVFDLNFVKVASPEEIPIEALTDVLNAPEMLLSKLKPELDALAPGDYRGKHFKALMRLSTDIYVPQKLDEIDLNQLVKSTVNGFDAYIAAPHVSAGGHESTCWKKEATEDMSIFLARVIPHMVIDYKGFTGLSSDTKVFLASNGFDFKKIPGMTRQDRGLILSDQLGL